MSRPVILTDLNRCVGCLACVTACKTVNEVPIGKYWCKPNRVGPYPDGEGAQFPNVYHYWLTMQCQHCANPQCVEICPTGATFVDADGSVQIDAGVCIGCGLCLSACPYGVRYVDDESGVAQKCNLCQDKTEKGELPQCVAQCGGRARFFGDLDEVGIEGLKGAGRVDKAVDPSYDAVLSVFDTVADACEPFEADQVYRLDDSGNDPQFLYVLRRHEWKGHAYTR